MFRGQTASIVLSTILIIIVAVLPRVFWLLGEGNLENYFAGTVLVNPDGFYYANIIKQMLAGDFTNTQRPFVWFCFLLYSPLSFFVSLDMFLFYLPILASVVLPIFIYNLKLLQDNLANTTASIFVAVASGFVERTALGYFDDDFFNFTLLFVGVFSCIVYLKTSDKNKLFLAFFVFVLTSLDYKNSPQFVMMFSLFVLAISFFMEKRNEFLKVAIVSFVASCLSVALLNMNAMGAILLSLVLLFPLVATFRILDSGKNLALLSPLLFGIVPFYIVMEGAITKFEQYIFRGNIFTADKIALTYKDTLSYVEESSPSSIWSILDWISYSPALFVLSAIGLCFLVKRERAFILLAPFVLLGLCGYWGGIRFAVFASIPLAFALGYFATSFLDVSPTKKKIITLALLLSVGSASYARTSGTPINTLPYSDVLVLKEISSKIPVELRKHTYFASWWDYGFQIAYATDCETMSDNGSFAGSINYAEAIALTTDNKKLAENLLYEFALDKSGMNESITGASPLERICKKYGYSPSHYPELLEFLSKATIEKNQKISVIRYYNPKLLSPLMPKILEVAQTDLLGGKKVDDGRFWAHFGEIRSGKDGVLVLGSSYALDPKKGVLKDINEGSIVCNIFGISGRKIVDKNSDTNFYFLSANSGFLTNIHNPITDNLEKQIKE